MCFKRILPVQLFALLFLAGAVAATDPTPIENLLAVSNAAGPPLQGSDGRLYISQVAGYPSYGSLIAFDPASGTASTLHTFSFSDGGYPLPLIESTDGVLYGVTMRGGGIGRHGTVFRLAPSGGLTILHRFNGTNGAGPHGSLIQASDGDFYGTTEWGGAHNLGTIFRIDAAGALVTLHSFTGMDGSRPFAGLIQTSDGHFLGTTLTGGTSNRGAVYRLDTGGAVTSIHSFNGTDGDMPGELMQANDGHVYGATRQGGDHGLGTVFRLELSATLVTLHSFDGADGQFPGGRLVEAEDGRLYGTSHQSPMMAVFALDTDGAFATLYRFFGNPYGPQGLALTGDRRFYGVTNDRLVRLTVLDLVGVSVTFPPSVVAPGGSFSVTDVVSNAELSAAGSFAVRFYLSTDTVKSRDDKRLAATRQVLNLSSGDESQGHVTLKVPQSTNLGTYRVLACADDLNVLAETNEINNCVASESSVLVALPDLVVTEIGSPPSAIAPGQKLDVNDRVANLGSAPAGQTVTGYYFSFDRSRNSGDARLTGNRNVPALIGGDSNAGSRRVTVPLSIPAGTYYLLACADDLSRAAESNEENNCRASASPVVVAAP